MSNELKRAFEALSDDADRGRLDPATTLRRRGDRRRAVTAVAGTLTAAVLVAGVIAGSRLLLAGPDAPTPQPVPADSIPTASPAPSASTSPGSAPPPTTGSTTPTTTPTTTPARSIPSSIPAKAFLQSTDVPGRINGAPRRVEPGEQPLPEFCGKDYAQAARVGVQATQRLNFEDADAPEGGIPNARVYEQIMVFRGKAAESFMAGLRAAVRDCATEAEAKNYDRGSLNAGDQSILIERTTPGFGDDGEPLGDGSLHYLYWAVVRVGDAVAFVSNTGWEAVSAERADTVHLGKQAASRLAAWRD